MKEKILWGIAVVALVLSGLAFLGSAQGARIASNFGAAGNLLAEQYIPYVLYNGGYNSAKDFLISGLSTFSGVFTVSGAATFSSSLVSSTTTTERLTTGGPVFASSTINSETLLAANLIANGSMVYTINVGPTTLTLPASSTLTSFIPNAGDRSTFYIRNGTSTTGATGVLTLAGAAGTILETASTTAGTNLTVGGGKSVLLNFWRNSTTTDIYVNMQPFQ